jgi:uncharacterized protein
MLYALICTDKPGSLDLRMAHRPEHMAYLESLGDSLASRGRSSRRTARPCAAAWS